MKTLKLLFNKVFWVALCVILQCALFALSVTYLYSYFWYVQIVFTILGVITFLYIVNDNSTPEIKLPWLVLVCTMPLLGTVLFSMFSQNNVRRRYHRYTDNLHALFREEGAHVFADTGEAPPMANGLDKYLTAASGFPVFKNTKVTYFSLGEEMFASLLTDLKSAEHFIFMEYFIVERGKMWDSVLEILKEKAENGVDVRVLYDDIGSARRLRNGYYKKLRKAGISCEKFNPFRPVISGVHNNRDHRKITVIDGQVAYTGGVNMADEYINHTHPLGKWKDTAVRLEGEAVNAFTLLFLSAYAKMSGNLSSPAPFLTATSAMEADGWVQPFGSGPKSTCEDGIAENVLLNLIYSAKRSIWITTPYLIIGHALKNALALAAKRGVDVRIVTPSVPDKRFVHAMTRSNYGALLAAGVKIYEYTPGFIHAKNVICDGEVAMVSTVNLDHRSLSHHFECGAVLYGGRVIGEIQRDFISLFLECKEIPKDFRQKAITRLFCAVLIVFAPLL